MPKYKVSIVFWGEITRNLHYEPYAKAWWFACPNDNNATYIPLYSLCLRMKTITIINGRDFMITVIQDNLEPGFLCQSEDLRSKPYKSSSEAITSIYQLAFFTKTKLNGLLVIGFDNIEICNSLILDLYFQPFSFRISNLNLSIFEIGISDNPDWNFASKGYKRNTLFGLENEQTKSAIEKEQTSHCTVEDWQKNNIIELIAKFEEIYPPNYIVKDRKLWAWKALL
ncbi:hypothetical protein C2G38_2189294 [Gigaspora rosea]|uniref:Uncharacterized protein n=1 Tax=Gigaspora rosea TaxID=44941 RepID=A0A397V2N8_9GLOM|nr:hypothetical protein C2G38_2189294 [Gigaspora rosea]